ncbi:MAG: hypothetical protein WCG25_08595 [bacterium]
MSIVISTDILFTYHIFTLASYHVNSTLFLSLSVCKFNFCFHVS